ncbi:DMT family transporter [Streptomyces sp. FH025]|uniref:DMT family transporter n=1 Tax=Streptomyces sp. FH025 TaxID=2815937 RepID=UPI0027DD97CE|nr:DMT family transporter [Streptomyces sp. FH025]
MTTRPSSRVTARGAVLCLVSASGFGLAPVFAKQAFATGAGVTTVLTARFALAAAVFWAVVLCRRPRRPHGRTLPAGLARGRTLPAGLALGAVGYAVQSAAYFGAVTRIDASLAALLLYAYPAVVTLLALALRRESPDRYRLAALVCSALGVLFLLGPGGAGPGADTAGVLLALGAAVTYALYLTAAGHLVKSLDLPLLSALVCTGACASLAVFGTATGGLRLPSEPAWTWIGLLALCSTVVPVLCLFAGTRALGAPTAAILSCTEVLVTVAAGAFCYGDRLTAGRVSGAVAVFASVVIVEHGRRRRERPRVEAPRPDRARRATARTEAPAPKGGTPQAVHRK